MKNLTEDGKIRLQNLGNQTRKNLKRQGKTEPPSKGKGFLVKKGTLVYQPANCDLPRKEWEAKMTDKHMNYHERQEKARLNGHAKKLSVRSKLLTANKGL